MAIKAGIDCSTGFLLATMDADGQNLPNDLLPMIQLLQSEQGAQIQMVQGIRTMRIDSWQKRLPSRVRQLHYSQMVGRFRHRHWVLVARVSEGSVD
jgi:hypothetical protein